jgi:hypothetical protein
MNLGVRPLRRSLENQLIWRGMDVTVGLEGCPGSRVVEILAGSAERVQRAPKAPVSLKPARPGKIGTRKRIQHDRMERPGCRAPTGSGWWGTRPFLENSTVC